MRELQVGAIGCGYWGPNLIRNIIELPLAEMVAVADLDRSRLDNIRTRFPQISLFTQDYQDLFNLGLDAVLISTPPPTHFIIARDCIINGLHVLVEKPMTTNSDDARQLIELAEQHERVLMVGHTFEYNAAVRALKEMIDSGELGEIHYIDAVRASLGLFHPTMNVIWDLAPHDISIFNHLLGKSPSSVSATGVANVQATVEDVAYMNMMFANDTLAHIRLSWLDPLKTRRITIVGSEKMAVYDDVESQEKIKIYDKSVKTVRRTDTFGEFQFAYHYGNVVSPFIRFEEPLRVECEHFLECIRTNQAPITDGYNGLRVVEIIEAAQRSLKNGGIQERIANSRLDGTNGDGYSTVPLESPKSAISDEPLAY